MSIYAGLKLVTAPTSEPVTVDEAKSWIRVTGTADDSDITDMITNARQMVEGVLRRAMLTQTWRLALKNWPGRDYQNWPQGVSNGLAAYYQHDHIKLPMAAPLASVTGVTYRDTSNTLFTMTAGNVAGGYNVSTDFEPARIVLPFGGIWPTEILLPGDPIKITYVCGYTNVAALKAGAEWWAAALACMKMLVGYWYENRIPCSEGASDAVQNVIESQLAMFRIYV